MKFTEGRRAADSSIGRISHVTKTQAGQPQPDSAGSQPLDHTTADKTSESGCQANGPETDSERLTTSLAGAADHEPAATPAIRQGKVEAALRAIEAGALGNDPQGLADKIIESMLKK